MLTVLAQLKSLTPLSFNKIIKSERNSNESWGDFEARVWRERCDIDENGELYISPMKFKYSIITAAEHKNIKIEGEGQSKYQKHFRGGVVVMNAIKLGINLDDVSYAGYPDGIFTAPKPKDGRRWIRFPTIPEWSGELTINLLDEKITPEIFKAVFEHAGLCIGIGSWRPANRGENGRFTIEDIDFDAK